jgi:hypothetical protein
MDSAGGVVRKAARLPEKKLKNLSPTGLLRDQLRDAPRIAALPNAA